MIYLKILIVCFVIIYEIFSSWLLARPLLLCGYIVKWQSAFKASQHAMLQQERKIFSAICNLTQKRTNENGLFINIFHSKYFYNHALTLNFKALGIKRVWIEYQAFSVTIGCKVQIKTAFAPMHKSFSSINLATIW